ncbi:O-antigen ligase family protein [Neorhodopirellula lusitana]|uniref:O-antigen ligase family protein n=1 Tax=Neorhodopirellula lusitana TaxID=445327 RepID=UPI00384F8601
MTNSPGLEDRSVSLICQRVSEWTLYGCVLLSPWAFGCTGSTWEFVLVCGLAIALLAYGVGALVDGPVRWNGKKPALLIVAGLLGIASVALCHQLALPSSVIDSLAPGVSKWTQWELQPNLVEPWLGRWDSGNRLGLYTAGSFQTVVRLLLLVGVFVAVQNFRSPRACLHRLSVVAAITGTALALFGVAQHYGSHDGLVYWTFDVEGGLGFGPFINRNHYPFFLNLCLGLTMGLLVERLSVMGRHWYRLLLTDPIVGWLLVAISFMFASLVACGSRGGVLSIGLAMMIVMLLRLRASNATRGVLITSLIAMPTVLVLVWAGFDVHESRLNMLTEADRYTNDGRYHLWTAALKSVPDFLWLGSGGETFHYWDYIYQSGDPSWNNWKRMSLRADNEFLDVLCEYGIVGLLSLLLVTGTALWLAISRCRRDGLMAGAAMGIIAVVAHSCVDFGLRVPASAVLATVVMGLISASGRKRNESKRNREAALTSASPRTWPQLVGGGVVGVVLIGIAIGGTRIKSRYFYADRDRAAAYDALLLEQPEAAVQSAIAAVRATPEDIGIRFELSRVIQWVIDETDENATSGPDLQQLRRLMVQNSVASQRISPLAWQPYAWLAQYGQTEEVQSLSGDDAIPANWKTLCLLRARRLHPSEPDLAFLTGQRVLAESLLDEGVLDDRTPEERASEESESAESGLAAALPHWRDTLRYSAHHVDEILDFVGDDLQPEEMLEQLFPNDPIVLISAAKKLEDPELRSLFLNRALELLEVPEESTRDLPFGERESWRSKVFEALGDPDKSLRALDRALHDFPDSVPMRLRRVNLLMELGELDKATSEIRILLTLDPDNGQVKRLQEQLSKRKVLEQ